MELFALIKALLVLAFVAAGGLKMLQWVLIITGVLCALLALRRKRSPVMLTTGIVLLAGSIWLATIPLPGRSDLLGEPGQYATMRQREEARKACDAELTTLPDRYPVASLVDEAGGLQERSVIHLLTQRQLDFVEIRLSGNPDEMKIESYRSFARQLPRSAQDAEARYARLQLAPVGTAGCMVEKAMPKDMREYLAVYPLPQGLCIQLQYAAQASAQFSLAYVLEPQPDRPVWGHYRISDRASGNLVAQLTSADGREAPTHGNISLLNSAFQRPDCRTPHTALADRVVGLRYVEALPQQAAGR